MSWTKDISGIRPSAVGWPGHDVEVDWSHLSASTDPRQFAAAWLRLQSRAFEDSLTAAVVVFGAGPKSSFTPIAVWPDGSIGSPDLVAAIERTIKTRNVELRRRKKPAGKPDEAEAGGVVAYPIMVEGQVFGACAFEFTHLPENTQGEFLTQLRWGSAWLEILVHRNRESTADRLITALNSVATVIDHDSFRPAATALATELASKLLCDRLSIGFIKDKHVQLVALSHSANYDAKANLVRAIEAAMDEAVDQQSTIVFPGPDTGPLRIMRAHEILHAKHDVGSICTIPLANGDAVLGAIAFERAADELFTDSTVQLCEQVAALLGPILELKRKEDRSLVQNAREDLAEFVRKLLGPEHAFVKLTTGLLIALFLFFAFAKGDYRVTADARLEGMVQRAVSAPIDGFILEATARAGDTVESGEVLFSLDNRDLRLERLKWSSQRSQVSREYKDALAKHERSRASVLAAQIDQADAQLALIDEQLARMSVTAPFDSYVVSGDLSQSLGAPVERGDVLFELTPLHEYRVVLEVEERDIGEVREGQSGNLVVAGIPDERLPFVVERVTPVASASEGVNSFRVEARLLSERHPVLRPGMEGYGKVDVDRRRLIWIWTHKITYWLRMFFWSWWP